MIDLDPRVGEAGIYVDRFFSVEKGMVFGSLRGFVFVSWFEGELGS